jgi:hypothetical protein
MKTLPNNSNTGTGRVSIFASLFLESGPILNVPDGRYDPESQTYVRDDGSPAFAGSDGILATANGNEITTHWSTNVSGLVVTDPDNG